MKRKRENNEWLKKNDRKTKEITEENYRESEKLDVKEQNKCIWRKKSRI